MIQWGHRVIGHKQTNYPVLIAMSRAYYVTCSCGKTWFKG